MDEQLISFIKLLKDNNLDEKKEIHNALKHVFYTINGIYKSKQPIYINISSNTDRLFRKKLLLNYYITDAKILIKDELERYGCLDFIFPGACILIGEYDSRFCKLKTYINQLTALKTINI